MVQSSYNRRHRTRAGGTQRKRRIPREFYPLLARFTRDAHEQMELWWYALVLLMLDNAQVAMTGQHEAAGRTWITLRLNGDNEFDIVRPHLTEEMESQLREGVREIVAARRQRE